MWLVKQILGIDVPHNDESQWRWWLQHPELISCMVRSEVGGPENLQPGDLIWCEFEGGSGNGHEMIFIGSPKQSKYANPNWAYTYLQAPRTGLPVMLSEFVWDMRDTAHGGARGYRFGRFARLKGGEPEEDEMSFCREPATVGKVYRGHAWLGPLLDRTENCYLHFTGIADKTNVKVQVFNDGESKDLSGTVNLNKHLEINLAKSGLKGAVTFVAVCDQDTMISPDWRSIKG